MPGNGVRGDQLKVATGNIGGECIDTIQYHLELTFVGSLQSLAEVGWNNDAGVGTLIDDLFSEQTRVGREKLRYEELAIAGDHLRKRATLDGVSQVDNRDTHIAHLRVEAVGEYHHLHYRRKNQQEQQVLVSQSEAKLF